MECLFFVYLFLCFVLLISGCFSSSFEHHLCSPTEASALLQFKQSFEITDYSSYRCGRASFPKTKSWNESRDCFTWAGVNCDMLTGHVIALDLSCSQLNGSIHPNSSLFQLHHLQTLNLAHNYFNYSSIPHGIGRLRNLRHLNLDDSSFHGKIPTEISYLSHLVSLNLSYIDGLQFDERTFEAMLQNLTNLEVLSLPGVNISSPIPMNMSSSLRYVDLQFTKLRGVLPESLFLLPNLENLKLGWNDLLKGVLPKFHWRNTLLIELDISYTGISGELPNSIGTLSSLNILNLQQCQFSGSIPDSIGNLSSLNILNFQVCQFSGSIPDSIGNLTQIRKLDLSYNNFTGHIPSTILNLTHLKYLDLSSNSLSGPLPNNASILQKLTLLELSYNSLNGTIPSWVFSLPWLSYLSLGHNQLSGLADEIKTNPALEYLKYLLLSSCELKDFPHLLRNVKTLEALDISNNKICGQIPNWFSSMRWDTLLYLNFSHNSLTGHLKQFHHHNLELLDLKFNSLQGPLPSSICNMSRLGFLDLSRNNFSGSVQHCLGSMVELSVLDLRRNNFTGSLPRFCAQSTSLSTIVINANRFEGILPVSLLNCYGLEVLDVGKNAINDTFPAWLGKLQQLQVLVLKSNVFHGPISTCQTKFCFPKLRIFDLSRNEFSGSLPARLFEKFSAIIKLDGEDRGEIEYMEHHIYYTLNTNTELGASYEDSMSLVIKGQPMDLERINKIMTTIDLSSNHFEGIIPKTLTDLSSLWQLNLSRNNLTGDIPMEFGQLNMLEALDLSWNRLTGKIPQELTRLTFLGKLNLSHNLLVGPIPQGPQFNTFENDSYGGNLDLCGPPLSKKCGISDSLESEEDEEESYFFSGFTWESVVTGYSFGLVVGTVVWSLMFKYRKPKWFVEFFDGIMPHKRRPKKRAQRRRS